MFIRAFFTANRAAIKPTYVDRPKLHWEEEKSKKLCKRPRREEEKKGIKPWMGLGKVEKKTVNEPKE